MMLKPEPNFRPFRPASSVGEACHACGADAYRKVEEVIFHDDPMPYRHPLTAYLCLGCFQSVMSGRRVVKVPANSEVGELERLLREGEWVPVPSPDYDLALGLLREVRDYLRDEHGWQERGIERDLLTRVEALLGDAD